MSVGPSIDPSVSLSVCSIKYLQKVLKERFFNLIDVRLVTVLSLKEEEEEDEEEGEEEDEEKVQGTHKDGKIFKQQLDAFKGGFVGRSVGLSSKIFQKVLKQRFLII